MVVFRPHVNRFIRNIQWSSSNSGLTVRRHELDEVIKVLCEGACVVVEGSGVDSGELGVEIGHLSRPPDLVLHEVVDILVGLVEPVALAVDVVGGHRGGVPEGGVIIHAHTLNRMILFERRIIIDN